MNEKTIERVIEAPAIVLEKTLDTSRQITENIANKTHIGKAKEYWHSLGPGFTTGAADDDPSGIATYSQTGAQYGLQLLWLSLFTFPLMAIVQEMCARIGLVTGRGLAGNIRRHFPKWILYTCTILLFWANTLNLGADLGAMAKTTQLLLPNFSFELIILSFAFFILALQIFASYANYAKYLKWLALVLFSYIFSALSIKDIDWGNVAYHTVIPSITFSKEQIILICAILGTTISPYLFFWQTSQEVEEEILKGKVTLKLRQGTTSGEIKNMRIDVWSGMFFSNIVMFFIMVATAATLFTHGITDIRTVSDAAEALRPFAGESTYLLFTLGVIGTGMLAVPVFAGSASYALSESLGWKSGLHRKLKQAYAFYGAIIISTLIGLFINFIGIDPIGALVASAIVNGLIAPLVILLVVLISSSKRIMGDQVNSKPISAIGWVLVFIMMISAVAAVVSFMSA